MNNLTNHHTSSGLEPPTLRKEASTLPTELHHLPTVLIYFACSFYKLIFLYNNSFSLPCSALFKLFALLLA
jgi:hypothetical protein